MTLVSSPSEPCPSPRRAERQACGRPRSLAAWRGSGRLAGRAVRAPGPERLGRPASLHGPPTSVGRFRGPLHGDSETTTSHLLLPRLLRATSPLTWLGQVASLLPAPSSVGSPPGPSATCSPGHCFVVLCQSPRSGSLRPGPCTRALPSRSRTTPHTGSLSGPQARQGLAVQSLGRESSVPRYLLGGPVGSCKAFLAPHPVREDSPDHVWLVAQAQQAWGCGVTTQPLSVR